MFYPWNWLQRAVFVVKYFFETSCNEEDAKRGNLQGGETFPVEVRVYGFVTALENNPKYPRSAKVLNTAKAIAVDPFIAEIDKALKEIPFDEGGVIPEDVKKRFLRHTMNLWRPSKRRYEIRTTKGVLIINTK